MIIIFYFFEKDFKEIYIDSKMLINGIFRNLSKKAIKGKFQKNKKYLV